LKQKNKTPLKRGEKHLKQNKTILMSLTSFIDRQFKKKLDIAIIESFEVFSYAKQIKGHIL